MKLNYIVLQENLFQSRLVKNVSQTGKGDGHHDGCLQLLASGSYLYGPKGIQAGTIDVIAALESIKNKGIVKDPNGQKHLEAKLGFKLDVENAWNVLFPQEEFACSPKIVSE